MAASRPTIAQTLNAGVIALELGTEDVAEGTNDPEALGRRCKVDPRDDRRPQAEAEPETAAEMQVRRREIALERDDLAGIDEKRHVQQAERLPAVLESQDRRVIVAEAVRNKAAEIVAAAQHGLQVERHRVVALGVRENDGRAHGDDAASVEVREVLLDLEFGLPEGKRLALYVPVLAIPDAVQSAAARAGEGVTRVEVRKRAKPGVVRVGGKSGDGRRRERLVNRRKTFLTACFGVRVEVAAGRAKVQIAHRLERPGEIAGKIVVSIARPVVVRRGIALTEVINLRGMLELGVPAKRRAVSAQPMEIQVEVEHVGAVDGASHRSARVQ